MYRKIIIAIIKICKNWPTVIVAKFLNLPIGEVKLRNGVSFTYNDILPKADLSMLAEIWLSHDYTPDGFDIRPSDVVFDIGANNGFFTVFAAKQAIRGIVVAFEPVPFLADRIKNNIQGNNLTNVTLEPMAVSGANQETSFYLSDAHNGCHSLYKRDISDGNKITVKTVTLEDYCNKSQIKIINHLKLDCEGAEYEIFQSLSLNFLQTRIEKISMEFHDTLTGHSHQEIIQKLETAGYKAWTVFGYLYAININMQKPNI